jgi:hypothetical protein
MKLYAEVEQGSAEWFALRLGKLTGFDAQAIATNGKGLETLIFEKVAERMTGKMKPQYTNEDMTRGNELESLGRDTYELETNNIVRRIGFAELNEYVGSSPDGLIAKDGMLEVKCKNDALFAKYMYEGKIEAAHNWQIQMNLHILGREWCDYVIFNENFPKTTIITRIAKNEADIAKLKVGIAQGIAMMNTILSKIKQ